MRNASVSKTRAALIFGKGLVILDKWCSQADWPEAQPLFRDFQKRTQRLNSARVCWTELTRHRWKRYPMLWCQPTPCRPSIERSVASTGMSSPEKNLITHVTSGTNLHRKPTCPAFCKQRVRLFSLSSLRCVKSGFPKLCGPQTHAYLRILFLSEPTRMSHQPFRPTSAEGWKYETKNWWHLIMLSCAKLIASIGRVGLPHTAKYMNSRSYFWQLTGKSRAHGKSGPVFCLHICKSWKFCLIRVGSDKRQ